MLILTRRVGEKLIINENVEVIVLGIKGNQARIGIEAPDEVSVHREEIYEKIKKSKEDELKKVCGNIIERVKGLME
jgi:carbon storage regulator